MKKNAVKILSLIGMPGAGKTSAGRVIAAQTGADFIDADAEIEKAAGLTIAEIFQTKGEEEFRKMEAEMLREILQSGGRAAPLVLSAGGGAVLLAANRDLLRTKTVCVYLSAAAPVLAGRLKNETAARPLLAGDAEEKIAALLRARRKLYKKTAHATVRQNADETAEVIARRVMRKAKIFRD